MKRKTACVLIFIFALSSFFSNMSFYYSAAFAKEKTIVEKQKEEETKSAFRKALETVVAPLAYTLHWLWIKIFGPSTVNVRYTIMASLRLLPKDKKLREIFMKVDNPNRREKVTHIEIKLYDNYVNSEEYKKNVDTPITLHVPIVLYKGGKQTIFIDQFVSKNVYGNPLNTASTLETKYGDMIKLRDNTPPGLGYINLDRVFLFSHVTRHILPYDLSGDYTLSYEETVTEKKQEAQKGFSLQVQKIVTYIYAYWEGKAQMELRFWIGMGARFGKAGRTGMAFELSNEQSDKMVEYGENRDNYGRIDARWLIFKKPGWHKIYLNKTSGMSPL